MIIRSPFNRPFGVFGIIGLPSAIYDLPSETVYRRSHVVHEMTHINRQGNFVQCLVWIIKYFASKAFRREEETASFTIQLAMLVKAGLVEKVEIIKRGMLSGYWGAFTKQDIDFILEKVNRG